MTVCIAAVCEKGAKCVVAADRQITVGFPLNIEFEHHERKIEELLKACVLMSSGNALVSAEVMRRAKRGLSALPGEIMVETAGTAVRDTYMALHMERAESLILRPRGLTLDEFKNSGATKLRPEVYAQIDNLFWNFTLNTDFVLAGVDSSGAHLGWVHYHGVQGVGWLEWFDKLGYQAIGSGASHAVILLALSGQNGDLTVEETVFNVFSAKVNAEVAPGVGDETDLAILMKDRVEFVSQDFLEKLNKIREEAYPRSEQALVKVRELFGMGKETER